MSLVIFLLHPPTYLPGAIDARIKSNIGQLGMAIEAHAKRHNGKYPVALQDLMKEKDLKQLPEHGVLITAPDRSEALIYEELKLADKCRHTTYWVYRTTNGRAQEECSPTIPSLYLIPTVVP